MIRRLIFTCLAAGFVLHAPEAQAKQCKPKSEQVAAPGLFPESAARQAAQLAWIHLVQIKFGQPWAHPGFAAGLRVSCAKSPNGFGGYVYTCIHRARPCKL